MRLTIACAAYDRTQPLIDGRVKVQGCEARVLVLDHEDMFVRALVHAEFDATELSFGRFALNVARGSSPYVALPVFLSRVFRHSAIYVRGDRGIVHPVDLRGRLIGVRDYSNTASVVARGMLEDEYGVRASQMRWLVGDVDHPERAHIQPPDLADGFDVRVAEDGALLSDLLAQGAIDGLVDFQPPRSFVTGAPHVVRLFPDYEQAERAYFAHTGIFPIMHVLVVRRTIAEREPEVVKRLYRAFCDARDVALRDLWSPAAPKISLPWISEEYRRTVALMGPDFWPYGIAASRPAIECVPRYLAAQGLTARPPRVEELFAGCLLDT
jgi:4,5-dihydroxyphthalate decarboxylase